MPVSGVVEACFLIPCGCYRIDRSHAGSLDTYNYGLVFDVSVMSRTRRTSVRRPSAAGKNEGPGSILARPLYNVLVGVPGIFGFLLSRLTWD